MKNIYIKIFILTIIFFLTYSLKAEKVYFIPKTDITEMVDLPFANFIKRTIKKAENEGASALIIELNTPGGRVDAALRITDALLSTRLKTVVFINKNAISAGALISLSAEKIFMAPAGVIGASTPVYMKNGKTETASEKMISVMRAQMRTCAEKHGRSLKVVEAMVDPDIRLYKKQDGINLAKGKLLTLTTREALNLMIADHKAEGLQDILKILKLEKAAVIQALPTSMDKAVSFLTHPLVSGILMTLGVLGLIFEVKTAGWGVGGTVGILCLSLFFISQVMAGYASWGAVVLFIVGIILLGVEVFIVPGFGIVGMSGIAAIAVSFFMSFSSFTIALYSIFLVMVACAVGIYFMAKFLPKITIFNRLILQFSEAKKNGFQVSSKKIKSLEGHKGEVITPLRPAGKAEIGGQLVDVMSDGDFINKGEKIKVLRVEGNRVVVKKINKLK